MNQYKQRRQEFYEIGLLYFHGKNIPHEVYMETARRFLATPQPFTELELRAQELVAQIKARK